jgi:hypothetical protein
MARATWHPYGPDQAFGHRASEDEQLLDQAIARLEQLRGQPPRAGGKARPSGEAATGAAAALRIGSWIGAGAGLPVTTNVALDAAASLRSEAE